MWRSLALLATAACGPTRPDPGAPSTGSDGDTDHHHTVDTSVSAPCDDLAPDAFCDDFTQRDLDAWWYALRHWGPDPPRCTGVIPENVAVVDGVARFSARGDLYEGPLNGVRKAGGYIQDQPGARSGGLLVTDAYYASGSYEFRMRLPSQIGAATSVWTFHYREIYDSYGYTISNHEIDIETPTALQGGGEVSHRNARYNTWLGEAGDEYTANIVDQGADLADGAFHTWRFDWHTGSALEARRVEFYVDDQLKATNTTYVPTVAGRLYIGIWFPEWAGGSAPFDTETLDIDWVRITPFHEEGDAFIPETYPGDGLTKCDNKADNDAQLPECAG